MNFSVLFASASDYTRMPFVEGMALLYLVVCTNTLLVMLLGIIGSSLWTVCAMFLQVFLLIITLSCCTCRGLMCQNVSSRRSKIPGRSPQEIRSQNHPVEILRNLKGKAQLHPQEIIILDERTPEPSHQPSSSKKRRIRKAMLKTRGSHQWSTQFLASYDPLSQ